MLCCRIGFNANSEIDEILNRPGVQLEDLIEYEFILNEVKFQNSRLLEFVVTSNSISKLMNYSIGKQNVETDDQSQVLR